MKKLILFIILGCLSLNGFPINPIDPLAKTGEGINIFSAQSPVTTEECSDLFSLVPVTVIITFTDCPDEYTCNYPTNCTLYICIYDQNDNQLGCLLFDLETCQYTFEGIRAEEHSTLYSKLVANGSCSSCYNQDKNYSTQVPSGGGTVYIYQTFCCKL
jgi:hypothetical protein